MEHLKGEKKMTKKKIKEQLSRIEPDKIVDIHQMSGVVEVITIRNHTVYRKRYVITPEGKLHFYENYLLENRYFWEKEVRE